VRSDLRLGRGVGQLCFFKLRRKAGSVGRDGTALLLACVPFRDEIGSKGRDDLLRDRKWDEAHTIGIGANEGWLSTEWIKLR